MGRGSATSQRAEGSMTTEAFRRVACFPEALVLGTVQSCIIVSEEAVFGPSHR